MCVFHQRVSIGHIARFEVFMVVKFQVEVFWVVVPCTRAIRKVHGLTLLLQVRTFWRYGDDLFFELPPMVSNALLKMLHPLLKNMLQAICHKLQDDSRTGTVLGLPL
jgi:hypothetical protein